MNVEDPRYIVVENGIIRQLQVTNVSAADEGIYSCRVQSKQSDAKLLVARTYNALHILSVLCKFVNDLKLYVTTHRRFSLDPKLAVPGRMFCIIICCIITNDQVCCRGLFFMYISVCFFCQLCVCLICRTSKIGSN